jgi:hypothetical protein
MGVMGHRISGRLLIYVWPTQTAHSLRARKAGVPNPNQFRFKVMGHMGVLGHGCKVAAIPVVENHS